jgi:hypothetical protein
MKIELPKPGEQMPLHLANLQSRAVDRAMRDDTEVVAKATADAARSAMKGVKTRTQKNLRPLPDQTPVDLGAADAAAAAASTKAAADKAAAAKAAAAAATTGRK